MENRALEIDALRGIAALMIIINHFPVPKGFDEYFFGLFCTGVDLFFIISGFVILLTVQKTQNWKDFLINRFSRLYPTYWACATLSFIAILISQNFSEFKNSETYLIHSYLVNLSMLQFNFHYSNIDDSYWTLIIELIFYAIIFLILLFKQLKNIIPIGFIILLITILNRFYVKNLLDNNNYLTEISFNTPLLKYFPLFYSGILFYKLKTESKKNSYWILIGFSFLVQLYLYHVFYNNRASLTFYQYISILITIYLVFVLYVFNKLNFIVTKFTLWLGSVSFCLYLINLTIGYKIVFVYLSLHLNYLPSLGLTLIIIFALSILVHKFIEIPSIKLIRKLYKNSNLSAKTDIPT